MGIVSVKCFHYLMILQNDFYRATIETLEEHTIIIIMIPSAKMCDDCEIPL